MQERQFSPDSFILNRYCPPIDKHIADLIGAYSFERLLTGDQAQPKDQVKADPINWLQQFPDFEICCDSDYDVDLLKDFLKKFYKRKNAPD